MKEQGEDIDEKDDEEGDDTDEGMEVMEGEDEDREKGRLRK